MRGFVDWLAKIFFGKRVTELVKSLALTELWLKRSHDKVSARNKRIDSLIEKLRVSEQHLGTAKRTIQAKQRMINALRIEKKKCADGLAEWQETALEGKRLMAILVRDHKLELAEMRRKIKCIQEQLRVRKAKINKLTSEGIIGELKEENRNLFNRCGELRNDASNARRSLKVAKATIARLMDKKQK